MELIALRCFGARSGFKSHQVGLRREAFRVLALSALPDDAAFAAGESKLGEVPTARHEECEIQQHEASDVPSALSDLLRDKPACCAATSKPLSKLGHVKELALSCRGEAFRYNRYVSNGK